MIDFSILIPLMQQTLEWQKTYKGTIASSPTPRQPSTGLSPDKLKSIFAQKEKEAEEKMQALFKRRVDVSGDINAQRQQADRLGREQEKMQAPGVGEEQMMHPERGPQQGPELAGRQGIDFAARQELTGQRAPQQAQQGIQPIDNTAASAGPQGGYGPRPPSGGGGGGGDIAKAIGGILSGAASAVDSTGTSVADAGRQAIEQTVQQDSQVQQQEVGQQSSALQGLGQVQQQGGILGQAQAAPTMAPPPSPVPSTETTQPIAKQASGGVSQHTFNTIKKFENFISRPKYDVNAYRAGWGSDTYTTADGKVHRVRPGVPVSRADADRDLARRVPQFQNRAIRQVGKDVWNRLSGGTHSALTSITYNYGSLPDNVVAAVKTGNTQAIKRAILNLRHHNDGVNRRRRTVEANMVGR